MRRNVLSLKRFAELTRESKLEPGSPELTKTLGAIAVRAASTFAVERVVARAAEGEGEKETFRFRISTEAVDRYDSTVAVDGWKLQNYRKNPVVLWAHGIPYGTEPPVGRSVTVGVDGDALMAEVEFVSRDVYPFAGMIRDMVNGGFLRASSVSWDPLKWVFNDERGFWAVDYLEQDLLEWSIVPVPGNPEALLEARAAGVDLDPLAEWAERGLDDLVGKQLDDDARRRVSRLEAIRRGAGREPIVFVDVVADAEKRIADATARIEAAAAKLEARASSPAPAPELDGGAIVEAVRRAAPAIAREVLTTKQTGRLD